MDERTGNQVALDLANAFSYFANGASKQDIEEFAKLVNSDHRTLQQTMFAIMMKCVEMWAADYDNGYFDARNEMSCQASKQIVEHLDYNNPPAAPLFDKGKLLGLPYI